MLSYAAERYVVMVRDRMTGRCDPEHSGSLTLETAKMTAAAVRERGDVAEIWTVTSIHDYGIHD